MPNPGWPAVPIACRAIPGTAILPLALPGSMILAG